MHNRNQSTDPLPTQRLNASRSHFGLERSALIAQRTAKHQRSRMPDHATPVELEPTVLGLRFILLIG